MTFCGDTNQFVVFCVLI